MSLSQKRSLVSFQKQSRPTVSLNSGRLKEQNFLGDKGSHKRTGMEMELTKHLRVCLCGYDTICIVTRRDGDS